MNALPDLGDERTRGGFRGRFGILARRALTIDVAATRVRLSLVDLRTSELSKLTRMRVLLAELNAFRMAAEAEAALGDVERTAALDLLLKLLAQGRIRVRSAPMGGWAPDFSVFADGSGPFAALVGVHSFMRPAPFPGPLFYSQHGPDAAAAARGRFEEVWDRSHDVSAAITRLLGRVTDPALDQGALGDVAEVGKPLEPQGDICSESGGVAVDTPRHT